MEEPLLDDEPVSGAHCPTPEEDGREDPLTAAEHRAEEHRQSMLRALADLENVRRRTARESEQNRKYALEGFAKDLLPVADNLERALQAIRQQPEEPSEPARKALSALVDGVEMIRAELNKAFQKHGVVRIEALNAPFDPHLHQAVMEVPSPDALPGSVVMELQAGYLLNDRLLRPAMVGVAKDA
ncbi:MAG: nucleotide exchange factor GrpE [Magnetococcales bacterium]|nr:nucleotide exchange factor GrpE [Magnetococcales bacterium]